MKLKSQVFEAIRSRLGEFEDLGSQTVNGCWIELATSAVKALIVASRVDCGIYFSAV